MSSEKQQQGMMLPPDHFLSLRPSFASGSVAHPDSASAAPSTSTLASADFEVDTRTGFLPAEPGLLDVPARYALWESLLDRAKAGAVKINGVGEDTAVADSWRREVREMPVLRLPQEHLTAPILHRTSVTLAFLEHFYVHSHPSPVGSLAIPASISVPLLQVSTLLGLPPILTYATSVLYNVVPANPSQVFHPVDNPPVRCHSTFTGLASEDQFYLVSSMVELYGVRALDIMRKALDEAFVGDRLALKRITAYLRSLAASIEDLTEVMKTMRKGCDPAEFYHLIRPWFKGSDGEGPGGLGWLFEGAGEDGEGQRQAVSGPSAGQSSLVHSLDLFLGVDHSPRPSPQAGPSSSPSSVAKPVSKGDSTFMQRMLQYMPGPHRQFLLHLQANSPAVRDLVLANQDFDNGSLARAYDQAVTAMGKFRDYHFVIVATYIIQQARRPPPPHILARMAPPTTPEDAAPNSEEWKLGTEKLPTAAPLSEDEDDEPIRGTGGTALSQFLKLCKARTVENILGAPSK